MTRQKAFAWLAGAAFAAIAAAGTASAQDIRIGQTMPYSGPASAYSIIGKTEAAYFEMINDQGGVNGHKIKLISVDDGYVPVKTVEQIRNLAESQNVLFFFNTLGTPQNFAIQKYLNQKKIPQLSSPPARTTGATTRTFRGRWAISLP